MHLHLVEQDSVEFLFLDLENEPESLAFVANPKLRKSMKGIRFAILGRRTTPHWEEEQIWCFGPMGLQHLKRFTDKACFREFSLGSFRSKTSEPSPFIGRRGRDVRRRFIERLDRRIMNALRQTRRLDSELYNWCLVDPERRSAALLAYPKLAARMPHANIETSIALSGSLESALAHVLDHSPAVIRHFGRILPVFGEDRQRHGAMLNALEAIPPSHWPQTSVGMTRLYYLKKRVDEVIDSYGSAAERTTLRNTVMQDIDWQSIDWKTFSPHDAMDATRNLLKSLLAPAVMTASNLGILPPVKLDTLTALAEKKYSKTHRQALAKIVSILMGSGGLIAYHRFSAAWHERTGNFSTLVDKLPPELRFPALVSETVELEGYRFVPLLCAMELDAEHQRMKHCIDSYVDSCARGSIFAFHVDGPDDNFTMTIRYSSGGRLILDSARGFKNEVKEIYDAIGNKFVEHLIAAGKTIPVGGEEARENVLSRAGIHAWAENPEIPRKIAETLFPRWQAILPKRLRADSPVELITLSFRPVIEQALSKKKDSRRATLAKAA